MTRAYLCLALLAGAPALAQQPAPVVRVDPNTQVTLTLGELTQIIQAEIATAAAQSAQAQAASAIMKLRQQITTPQQTTVRPPSVAK